MKITKEEYHKGFNPFPTVLWSSKLRSFAFELSNILNITGFDVYKKDFKTKIVDGVQIKMANFDSSVVDKYGKKVIYQRGLEWELFDKCELIDTIVNGRSMGSIIVRANSWEFIQEQIKSGNNDVCFYDIVDGKQRLTTLIEFISDGFLYKGHKFSEFSHYAKNKFLGFLNVSYFQTIEDITDKEIKDIFLNVNKSGRLMSPLHIAFVESIEMD